MPNRKKRWNKKHPEKWTDIHWHKW